tara:strand:+ start:3066 stop:3206 length:141 start_codon:yes stop_codon:yes gene_type:complete
MQELTFDEWVTKYHDENSKLSEEVQYEEHLDEKSENEQAEFKDREL